MALQQFANSILGGRRRSSNKASRDRDASAPPRVSQPTDASLQVTNGDKTDKKPEPPKIVPVSATSEIRSSWLNLSDKTEIQKGLDPPFSKKYKASVSDVSPPEAPEVLEKLEEIRRPMSGSFLYKRQETLTDAKLRLSKNAANPLELARRTANNVDSTRPTVQSKVAKYQNVTAAPQAKVLPTIRKEPETPTASIAPTWNAPKVVDSPATKLKATVSQWGFNNKTQQKTSKSKLPHSSIQLKLHCETWGFLTKQQVLLISHLVP